MLTSNHVTVGIGWDLVVEKIVVAPAWFLEVSTHALVSMVGA